MHQRGEWWNGFDGDADGEVGGTPDQIERAKRDGDRGAVRRYGCAPGGSGIVLWYRQGSSEYTGGICHRVPSQRISPLKVSTSINTVVIDQCRKGRCFRPRRSATRIAPQASTTQGAAQVHSARPEEIVAHRKGECRVGAALGAPEAEHPDQRRISPFVASRFPRNPSTCISLARSVARLPVGRR